MSTTIDSRVVEMRFDNSHFEKNVSTTMSTLDKLKAKLGFSGATKGLEDVSSAAKKVDLSPIGKSADTVGLRFNAMYTIADQALRNITNSVMRTATNMVKSLTVAPVTDGFREYEMVLNAVQTTMAGTGKTAEEVEKELQKLDEYADKTVYSTSDMLNNLPKFTNAGVALEDATKAMIGIANATALAGGDAGKASIAFYNLGQAIGTGYLTRMDYNSINNAGIATMEWKNQMVEAAIAAGTLTKVGEDQYKAGNKTLTLQQLFIEGLQEQWATTDVMMTVFGKYGDALDEDVGKKAYAAAQDIKTFSMMMDSLKATAGTGWKETWQTIFGGLDEAKEFWTSLSNVLSGIITGAADIRNRILEIALNFSKPWSAMMDKFDNIKKVTSNITDAADKLKYFQDVVTKVWRGDFNNRGDNPDRYDLLRKVGYDPRVVQDLVNKGYGYKLTIEDIEASHKKFGLTMETTTEETQNLVDVLNNLTDEQLKEVGLTEDEIRLYRALEKEAKKYGMTATELGDMMSEVDGRELLIESFKDIGKAIGDTFAIAKEAYKVIFQPPSVEEIGVSLYGVILSIKTYTESLRNLLIEEERAADGSIVLTETGDKLVRTFKGIFAAVDIVLTVIGGPLKLAFKLITGLLRALDLPILDVTASIGDMLVVFNNWLDSVLDFEGMFRALFAFFEEMPKHVKNWFASFKDSKIFKSLAPLIEALRKRISGLVDAIKQTKAFKSISKFLKPFFDSVKSWIDGFKEAENIPKYIFDGLINGLKNGATKIWNFVSNIFVTLIETVKNVLGIHSPSKVFMVIGGFIIAGLIAGMKDGLPESLSFIKDFFQPITDFIVGLDLGGLFAKGAGAIGGLAVPIGNAIGAFTSKIYEAIKAGIQPTIDFLKDINFGDILTKAIGIGTVVTIYKLGNAIGSIGKAFNRLSDFLHDMKKPLTNVVNNFAKVEKAFAFNMRMEGIKKLCISILMLVAAIVVLALIPTDKIWTAVGIVAGLIILLGVFAAIMAKLDDSAMKLDKSGLNIKGLSANLAGIGAAILMIGAVVAIIGKMHWTQALQGGAGLIIIMGLLIGFVAISQKLVKPTNMVALVAMSKMLNYLSGAIIKMALVAVLLGYLNAGKVAEGLGFITAFMVLIGAMMWATKFIASGKEIEQFGKAISKIAGAIAIMALVAVLLGYLDKNKIQEGIDFIAQFMVMIGAMMWATKFIASGKEIEQFGKAILGIAGAIAIMAGIAMILGKCDFWELAQGTLFIGAFAAMVVILMAATNIVVGGKSKRIEQFGKAILGIAGAIAIMALVAAILGKCDFWELAQGTIFMAAFAGMIVGLMAATKLLVKDNKQLKKLTKILLVVAGVIAIMAGLAILLGYLDPAKIWSGVGAIAVLSGMFALLMYTAKNVNKGMGVIIALTVAIGVMGIVVALLSHFDPANVLASALALGSLMLVMAKLVLPAVIKAGEKCKQALLGALGLLALAVPLAAFAGVLMLMNFTEHAIERVVAISAMAYAMSGVMTILTKIGGRWTNALKGALGLLALAVPLAAFAGVLMLMNFTKNAIGNALALGVLAAVMTEVLIPLGVIGKKLGWRALIGVLALTAMAVPLALFVGVLYCMQGIDNAMTNVNALVYLTAALTLLLIPLGLIGAVLSWPALIGVLALTAMVVPLWLFIELIALMSGIENGIANAMALTTLISAIGDILVKVSLVAPFAVVAVAALAALMAVMIAFGAFATVIGALVTWFPALQKFIDTGIPLMVKLASGLGQMIGAFIAGVAGEIMVLLPQLGLCLGQFMTNAMPFINGVKMVDESVALGSAILVGAILALTVADLINGVASFLSGSSFAELGTQLSMFMLNATPFILGMSMVRPEMVDGVKALAETILILTAANVLEGLTAWLTGGSSIEEFAGQLPILGQGLAAFSASLGAFTEDQVNTVRCAAESVKALAQAANEIPNSGGWIGKIVGENNLGTFAEQFPHLGRGLRGLLNTVGTFTPDEVATVNCTAEAVKTLASVAKEIPNSGGWVGAIVGENDLASFADQFPHLGTGLRGLLNNMGSFTDEEGHAVDLAANSVKSLASVAKEIPNSGGWVGAIVGENNLGDFASQFPHLGTGLRGFLDNIGTFSEEQCATVDLAASAVKSLSNAAKSIPAESNWLQKLFGGGDSVSLAEFANNFPAVGTGLKGFANNLGTFSSDKVSTVQAGVSALNSIANISKLDLESVNSKIGTFGTKLSSLGTKLSEFCNKMPSVTLTNSSIDNLKNIINAAKQIADVNSGTFSTFADNLKKVSKDAVSKFVNAFSDPIAKVEIESNAKTLADKAVSGAESKATGKNSMESAGKDLGAGLVVGIDAKQDAVYWAGYRLGQKAVEGEKDGQKSNSPSKLTIQAGKWIGEGLVIGMGRMGNSVYKSGYTLGQTATNSISSTISRISDMVNTDIDSQPTIRPVLDLSDVRAGASTLSGMLDMNSSVGVSANIGAITSMMNTRGQNGDNSVDLLSAINGLRKDIADNPRNAYNINGISVNEGSDAADAIQTLVRVITMEGRS